MAHYWAMAHRLKTPGLDQCFLAAGARLPSVVSITSQGCASPYVLYNLESFCKLFLQVFPTFTIYLNVSRLETKDNYLSEA